MTAQTPISVAVLGASGYSGGELIRLLLDHPVARILSLGVRDPENRTIESIQPHLAGRIHAPLVDLSPEGAGQAEYVFLAMPSGLSSELAPKLLDAGARVIDLAGDFRLPASEYPEWYGFEHQAPEWLDKAAYGLPELFAEKIAGADLVANPGCYATAAILSLAPLLSAGLVDAGPIMCDGKSGLSGAGKSLTESMMFSSAFESVRPYRFPKHQHTPEIENALAMATGLDPKVSFVPHLVPAVRGVTVTSYVPLTSDEVTTEKLTDCLREFYRMAPFVEVLAAGEMSDTKRVRGSNVLEVHAAADPRTGTAIVVGAEDNLVKGAAGQAIQNFNLMAGLDQVAGLPDVGVYP